EAEDGEAEAGEVRLVCVEGFEEGFGAGRRVALAVGGADDEVEGLWVEIGEVEFGHIENRDLGSVQFLGHRLGHLFRCAHFRTEQDDNTHLTTPSRELWKGNPNSRFPGGAEPPGHRARRAGRSICAASGRRWRRGPRSAPTTLPRRRARRGRPAPPPWAG